MIPLKDDNPTFHKPIVTIALIVINVIVQLYQISLGPEAQAFIIRFGLIPTELVHGFELTPNASFPASLNVITSMFMHGGIMHLAGNMLYLWIFGNNVEDVLGPIHFLVFYLIAGVFAAGLFVVTAPNAEVPLVGASGAISGVLGAYVLRWPKARVLTLIFFGWFIRVVWIPAMFVLGLWFLLQLILSLPSLGSANSGGVAYMAHIGGFVFGIGYAKLFWSKFQ